MTDINLDLATVPYKFHASFTTAVNTMLAVVEPNRPIEVDIIVSTGDGRGRGLAWAAPTMVWSDTLLTAEGIIVVDAYDMYLLRRTGMLRAVILHELLHVLGFGTLPAWGNQIDRDGFVGPTAVDAYRRLYSPGATAVPVEREGGPGTAGAHWSERHLGDEIGTGFLSGMTQPVTAVTVGALADLGWVTDPSNAERPSRVGPVIQAGNIRVCACQDDGLPDPGIGLMAPPSTGSSVPT